MADRPITPTRIIPAGAPLPERPPGPDDIPPWRAPAPAPAPPAPPAPPPPPAAAAPPEPPPASSAPIEVHVRFLPAEEPPPKPSRRRLFWEWITEIIPAWQVAAALLAVLVPIPGVGYSLSGVWTYTVGQARTEAGAAWAYALTGVPLLLAGRAFHRTRALRFLIVAVIAAIGLLFGALDPFDLVTITTGVTR
ncbi:hypothetical protein [Streptomyces filamentosus]|uniref:hypothetical protein n=1 Tax=Streptomyces filamentosus TaxID=67294 RepID=UPI0037D2B353